MMLECQPFELQMGEDRTVRADLYRASGGNAQGTLIVCHGYKGFKNWGMFPYAAQQLAVDVDVVSMNFSHNGVGADLLEFTELEKFAKATYAKDLEDLHTVLELIRSDAFVQRMAKEDGASVLFSSSEVGVRGDGGADDGKKPIFLLGHSRGGAVCLIYALDYPAEVAGVISWNGIADVDLFSEEDKAEMRLKGRSYTFNGRTKQNMPLDLEILHDMEQQRERYDIVGRIASAAVPIYLIQGTEDGDRRLAGSASLVAQNAEIHWIRVPDGDHTFGSVHPFRGETEALQQAIAESREAVRSMLSHFNSK